MSHAPPEAKGEMPPREAAERERSAVREAGKGAPPLQATEDAREEEGWTQPESSAQKEPDRE